MNAGSTKQAPFCDTDDGPVFPPPSVYLSIVGPLTVAAPHLKQLVLEHFDTRRLYQRYNDDESFDPTMDNCVHPWRLFIEVLKRLTHLDMQLTWDSSSIEQILANATCRMLRAAWRLTSLKLRIDANSSCRKFGNYEEMRVQRIPLLKSFRRVSVPSRPSQLENPLAARCGMYCSGTPTFPNTRDSPIAVPDTRQLHAATA